LTGSVLRVLVRRYLIAGLIVWVPVLVTVLVVRFIIDLMDSVLLVLPTGLRPEALLGVRIPGLGALLALVLLLLTGVMVSNMIGRTLVRSWEDLLNRIPFIRAIYSGVKSFSSTILSGSSKSFKKVVLIEYPRKGIWSIGFQTAAEVPWLAAHLSEPQVSVFIPTTPNPTSGFILIVPRSQVIELDMNIDEAMKMIVTLGVVAPEAPSPAPGRPESTAVSPSAPPSPSAPTAPVVPVARGT
jgi:uncharacterized membrane protein